MAESTSPSAVSTHGAKAKTPDAPPEEGQPAAATEYEELEEPKHVDATHILLHKYARVAVDLKTIGLPALTREFTIVSNEDEEAALISNVKSMKTMIFP